MIEGLTSGRIVVQENNVNNFVQGIAPNGIKFLGYINKDTGIISNFHPVIGF